MGDMRLQCVHACVRCTEGGPVDGVDGVNEANEVK